MLICPRILCACSLLDEALELLRPGGLYVIDDILPQENWPQGHAAKVPQLLAGLATRPDFRMVSMAWSRGVALVARSG